MSGGAAISRETHEFLSVALVMLLQGASLSLILFLLGASLSLPFHPPPRPPLASSPRFPLPFFVFLLYAPSLPPLPHHLFAYTKAEC